MKNCSEHRLSRPSLAFICYHTIPQWWDGHLPPGTAGSEEAVVEIARCFAAIGWRVVVFNNCGLTERTINNVQYIPLQHYQVANHFDVTVVWRTPSSFDRSIKSTAKYLWLHDEVPQKELTPERVSRLTKMIVVSNFQRELWPHIPDHKFLVSTNGIDSGQITREEASVVAMRDPKRCLYASAPDRGISGLWQASPQGFRNRDQFVPRSGRSLRKVVVSEVSKERSTGPSKSGICKGLFRYPFETT